MRTIDDKEEMKNAGHNMVIVGEPCNIDANANNHGLIMTMMWPMLYILTVTV